MAADEAMRKDESVGTRRHTGVGAANLAGLLDRIRSSKDGVEKAREIDSSTDWATQYTIAEGETVARFLATMVGERSDPTILEAVLNALAELDSHELLPRDVLLSAAALPDSEDPSAQEALDYLREAASWERPAVPELTHTC
ncbi:hypothetical protein GC722_00400 [Auraticoccus sp. F435]|uniref:Uncharacterized protein n=1 Tax=Auraticoccus cholistanensis TaxID=2656650 RepID=A0A6A9URW9_9ACTN|nr:hypothetical protein [Auraticoccus cholistanensis]MVA74502.1 hypothetical protein [Auraticoccus cholistanensis]